MRDPVIAEEANCTSCPSCLQHQQAWLVRWSFSADIVAFLAKIGGKETWKETATRKKAMKDSPHTLDHAASAVPASSERDRVEAIHRLYAQGLADIRSLLDEGIYSHTEFEAEKQKLDAKKEASLLRQGGEEALVPEQRSDCGIPAAGQLAAHADSRGRHTSGSAGDAGASATGAGAGGASAVVGEGNAGSTAGWWVRGSEYLGRKVRRAVYDESSGEIVGAEDGEIVGWLPLEVADFVSEFFNRPVALWHMVYDHEAVGEEDLEEFEVHDAIQS